MKRWVIDTNVPVVANGNDDGERSASPKCREASIHFLRHILGRNEHIVVDLASEIQREYHNNLNSGASQGSDSDSR